MFCVFQELSSCACKSWFCSMVENLSATTSFITFIKLLLRVRSIPWYIAQFCPLTAGQSSVPRMHGRQLITVGKKLNRWQVARLSLRIICRCLDWDLFFIYYITVNPSEVQLKVAKKQEKKKIKLKFFCRSFLYLE